MFQKSMIDHVVGTESGFPMFCLLVGRRGIFSPKQESSEFFSELAVVVSTQILMGSCVLYPKLIDRYQEILTDPSYAGQFVLMTQPHIGNTGVNLGTSFEAFSKIVDVDVPLLFV
jgi:hypothetical protein